MNIAVIFAGGTGSRMKGEYPMPKQFIEVEGKPILVHTLEIFEMHPEIDAIYISMLSEFIDFTHELIKKYGFKKVKGVVKGGETGQDSIYNALLTAKKENSNDDLVLIHDGVRPILTNEVISRNIETAKKNGNAITTLPCYETILISKDKISPCEVPFRAETFKAQAPQTFKLGEIISAHEETRKTNPSYENMVDSCTIYHTLGRATYMVEGNFGNLKVTTPEDVFIMRAMLYYKVHCAEKEKAGEK